MNKIGRFGEYGGQYVPEIVMNAVNELNEAYETYKNDPEFLAQLRQIIQRLRKPSISFILRREDDKRSWRGKSIFKTRRFEPYRCP